MSIKTILTYVICQTLWDGGISHCKHKNGLSTVNHCSMITRLEHCQKFGILQHFETLVF